MVLQVFFIEKIFELDRKTRFPPYLSPMESNLLDCIDLSEIPGAELIPRPKPAPKPAAKAPRKTKPVALPTHSEPVPVAVADGSGEREGIGTLVRTDHANALVPAKVQASRKDKASAKSKGESKDKASRKGESNRKERAGESGGESDIGEGEGGEWEHPASIPKNSSKKWVPLGRPPNRTYTQEGWERVLSGARLGMGMEKLWALSGMGENPFKRLLHAEPWRLEVIKEARDAGEHSLLVRVSECEHGWQGSAWLLERARGYVARASLEHTGKGGSQLSIAHEVVGMLGGKEPR